MIKPCDIRGPHLVTGDDEWTCYTHGVLAELKDPERYGAHNIRKDEVYCPVAADTARCRT